MREHMQGHWNPGTYEGYDCAHPRRIGPSGDGGKMVCLDAVPTAPAPCFVLSVGVGGDPGQPPDFRFEIALHQQLPHCDIHVYDGTNFGRGPIRNAPPYVHFFPENFTPNTWRKYAKMPHGVSIFKIDCEGCEFDGGVAAFLDRVPTEQLLIEVHAHGGRPLNQLTNFMTAVNKTHGIFYREPNIQHTDGTCIEFAFRKRGGRVLRSRAR